LPSIFANRLRSSAKRKFESTSSHLINTVKPSWSSFNCIVCALRFFYSTILKATFNVQAIPYGRAPKKLPEIMSQQEVLAVLEAVGNPKYRAALMAVYASGLRISETAELCVEDIDSKRMLIHVKQGKGNQDRIVPLSEKLLLFPREYYRLTRPERWLFPGKERPPDQRAIAAAGVQKGA
jgi:integrase/recombinase XerD